MTANQWGPPPSQGDPATTATPVQGSPPPTGSPGAPPLATPPPPTPVPGTPPLGTPPFGTPPPGFSPSWQGSRASRHGHEGPEWAAWSWASGTRDGRGVSWLGILLVLLGLALFINQVNRSIDVGSLFLLGIGLAFGAAWLLGGWLSATVPALVLVALGGVGLASALGYLTGPGWSELALGAALLIAWLLASVQKRRRTWAMWLGLILVVYGLARVLPAVLPGLPDAPWFGPAVLIAIGVLLLVRRSMDDRGALGRG